MPRLHRLTAGATPAAPHRSFRLVLLSLLLAVVMAVPSIAYTPSRANAAGDDMTAIDFAQGLGLAIGTNVGSHTWNGVLTVGSGLTKRTEGNDPMRDGPNLAQVGKTTQVIDLGNGISLPLVDNGDGRGLLGLGDMVGLLKGYSASNNQMHAKAAAGAVTDDGAIDLNIADTPNGTADPIRIDVMKLFSQGLLQYLHLDTLTDELIKSIALEVGVGASNAELKLENGVQSLHSDYTLANVGLDLEAPIVKNLISVVDVLTTSLKDLLGEKVLGQLGTLTSINGFKVADIQIDLPTDAINEFLQSEIASPAFTYNWTDSTDGKHYTEEVPAGLVSINLGTGKIHLDLSKLHAEGLNHLPPNTSLLRADEVNKILAGISRTLTGSADWKNIGLSAANDDTSVLGNLNRLLTNALNQTKVHIAVGSSESAGALIAVDLDLGKLNKGLSNITDPGVKIELLNTSAWAPGLYAIVNGLLGTLVGTLVTILSPLLTGVVPAVLNSVVSSVVAPLLRVLDPVLDGVSRVAKLTVNRQLVRAPGASGYTDGTLHSTAAINATLNGKYVGPTPYKGADHAAYHGESFSVAALDVGLVNFSTDGNSQELLSVTLAESTVRTPAASTSGQVSCTSISTGGLFPTTKSCYTITGVGLFDPDHPERTKVIYRGVEIGSAFSNSEIVEAKNIQVDGNDTDSHGLRYQQITFSKPNKPLGGWKDADPGTIQVIRTDASGNPLGDPGDSANPTTTPFYTQTFTVPYEGVTENPIDYEPAVVVPGSTVTSAHLSANNANPNGTFYLVDAQKMAALLGYALSNPTLINKSLHDSLMMASMRNGSIWIQPSQVDAIFPSDSSLTLTNAQKQILAAKLVDLAVSKLSDEEKTRSDALENLQAMFTNAQPSIVASGSTGSPLPAGTITVNSLTDVPTQMVSVIQVGSTCFTSYGVARFEKADTEIGTLPNTGGSGVDGYMLAAGGIALLTAVLTAVAAAGRRTA